MTTTTTNHQPTPTHHTEQILVVKRTHLFPESSWHGIQTDNIEHYLAIIRMHQEFKQRAAMEIDPTYKQIIPYMIFQHDNRYFLMQRRASASETRLQGKFTLGIGGHVRQEDLTSNDLFDWARREFNEEITYDGDLAVHPLGILNDDSNEVGRVHLGLVLLLSGDTNAISVKSELQSGRLVPLETCIEHADRLESWSLIVLNFLANTTQTHATTHCCKVY